MVSELNIIVSGKSDAPIYEQIKEQIKRAIMSGELAAGAALPSIRHLAAELQISVITTKRSYEELEKEALIETIAGKGSFVSGSNRELIREMRLKEWEAGIVKLLEETRALGMTAETLIASIRHFAEEGNE